MAATQTSIPVEAGGVTMDALAMGSGDPVLLVHGFTASKEAWFFNMEPLAVQFRVLAMDLPGHGSSTKVAPDNYLSFCSDFLARLLDRQRIEAAHVIGNSMGGAVAMQMALSHPKRVRKLVLVDALGMGTEVPAGVLDKYVESSTREDVQALLTQVVHDPKHVFPQAVERAYLYRQQPGVKEILPKIASQLRGDSSGPVDFRPRFKELRLPVLVVWGREDHILPARHADAAHAMPNARIHIFDRCGHLPQLEYAAEFNSLVTRFLRQP